jgi:hypothetical protein
MPGAGETAQAVVATRRLENSLHASIMTIGPCLCKTVAAANSPRGYAIRAIGQDPAKYGPRLSGSLELLARNRKEERCYRVADNPGAITRFGVNHPLISDQCRLGHVFTGHK